MKVKWCIHEFPKVEAVIWERSIVLLNQMVFQVNEAGYFCSVSEYVELHVEEGFLR